ncbi:hypothetical protein ACTOWA_02745 [Herbaspirillum seropedicae]|uniref:hypothetical protein n=1 Tax=Herbaspirillum seropedicae TaxID=964 RepID=UPI003F8D1137
MNIRSERTADSSWAKHSSQSQGFGASARRTPTNFPNSTFEVRMNSARAKASSRPLFVLGNTYITPGASLTLQNYSVTPRWLLQRHQSGDWKEMNAADRHQNLFAIRAHLRIVSIFALAEND